MRKIKLKNITELSILKKLKLKDRRYSVLKSNTNLFEQGIDSLDFFSLIFDLEKNIKLKLTKKCTQNLIQ